VKACNFPLKKTNPLRVLSTAELLFN